MGTLSRNKTVRPVAARRLGVLLGTLGLTAPLTLAISGPARAAAPACTTRTGPYQKEAEKFLGRPVDGRQSPADCKAIQDFQTSHRITPNIGFAGPVTWAAMQDEITRRDPNAAGKCPVNKGRIACVDLTRQISWIQDGRTVRFGPVPVRTGRAGYETRTGPKKIYWRAIDHWSTIYKVRMPYAQFFDGGQAFHAIDGSVWSPPGSHGCVNMRTGDARTYWSMLGNGDNVYIYGRKPGT
ncbi:L,D-transpeptidase [Streptomyces roseoverticillatus]|uniref:L,D-transpeptidase family protein n=1 Tax=Streptomyces roseoverticillatus TaxID=66429 RepID=UPI001F387EEF|nr:L,D-transpeptidase [Streptomyces roseoverticillatus]MCF3101181.1 L,D-transpeptidase [Streptomyces roseoverticillatus]